MRLLAVIALGLAWTAGCSVGQRLGDSGDADVGLDLSWDSDSRADVVDTDAWEDGANDGNVPPDASSVCTWHPRPTISEAGLCGPDGIRTCIDWAAQLGSTAIARCVLTGPGLPEEACSSASQCTDQFSCACGIEPPCADGSACVADGSNFHCAACAL
jgi:hypothetical protein